MTDSRLIDDKPVMHPIQISRLRGGKRPPVSSLVTMRAYEVYSHVFSPQPAIIDLVGRDCRGGFGVGELIAFLYAYPFPKSEWRARVDEAMKGMVT